MNKLLLSFLFLFFIVSEISAQTQIAGGEVYYELIGAKKYKVTAHIYRMCYWDPLDSLPGKVYCDNIVVPMSFTRVAISKINDTCGNPCNKQNKPSNAGFEKHTFVATVDFNKAPYDTFIKSNICFVYFGVKQNARNYGLTNFSSPYMPFYIDALINLCLPHITSNTSPQFSMEPKFKATRNLPFRYSPGPLDTLDNDSFVFSLGEVQSSFRIYPYYRSPYSQQIPVTPLCQPSGGINCTPVPDAPLPKGFYFDKQTCMTVFTPTAVEVSIILYKVDEYRYNRQLKKYEWLGYVTREMMVDVAYSGAGNPTVISAGNVLNLCTGNSKSCITIRTTDTNANKQAVDTTKLFWDKGIKGATFNILNPNAREKNGEFCWQAPKNIGKETRYFTVAAYDRKCNADLVTKTIAVNLYPQPAYTYTNAIGKCGLVKWKASAAYDSINPNYKATNTTVIRSFPANKILYTGNGLNDSTFVKNAGTIIIEHTFNQFCPTIIRDTFKVKGVLPAPDINNNTDTMVCNNISKQLNFKAYKIPNLQSLKWWVNGSLFNQTDSIISITFQKKTAVRLEVKDVDGCSSERTLTYSIKQHDAISSKDAFSCYGTIINVKANTGLVKKPLKYQWKVNGMDTAVNDSTLTFKAIKSAKVMLFMEDADKCVFKDSVMETVGPQVRFTFNSATEVCEDSVVKIKASEIRGAKPVIYQWQVNSTGNATNDSILSIKALGYMDVVLNIVDQNLCSYNDKISIQTIKVPRVKLPNDMQTCFNNPVSIIPTVANKPLVINYEWMSNGVVVDNSAILSRKFTSTELIQLKVSNVLNCSTSDEINVTVSQRTPLSFNINNTEFGPEDQVIILCTKTYKSYLWFNGNTNAAVAFKASVLGPSGKYKIWCKVIDFNGCEETDTIEITINKSVSVHQHYLEFLRIYPNPVSNILTIDITQNAEVELFSADGRMLGSYALQAGNNKIDMTAFAKGVYFIKGEMDGESFVYKLVKE